MRSVDWLFLWGRALVTHKSRTIMTLAISASGVALVVSLLSLLGGLRQAVEDQMKISGATLVRVEKDLLTWDDFHALGQFRPDIDFFPVGVLRFLAEGDQIRPASVVASPPTIHHVFGHRLRSGRFLEPTDDARSTIPCVIDGPLATELWGDAPADSLTIRLGAQRWELTVVGILAEPDSTLAVGSRYALAGDRIYVPPLQEHVRRLTTIWADAGDLERVPFLEKDLIRAVKKLWPEDSARVRRNDLVYHGHSHFQESVAQLGLALGIVSVLSSILSIAVLQTLLLRTRVGEISIRRVEGATTRHIALQVLGETAFLAGVGALAGIPLGLSMARYLSEHHLHWPVAFNANLAWLAFGLTLVSGSVAGTAAAWRAARLHPVEGLARAKEVT